MIKTASRTSVRCGAIGRCTRAAPPRRAQVTATGKVAKVEASAHRGTSTLHVETTVAVTMRGADADCACANAGAPARIAATRTGRTITLPFYGLSLIPTRPDAHATLFEPALTPSTYLI